MIFLISYDRSTQCLTEALESFLDSQRADASSRRLELELAYANDINHEVVLIEAESRDVLEVTHGRYFFSPSDLIIAAKKEVANSEEAHENAGQ